MPSFIYNNETYYATPQLDDNNYRLNLQDQNEIVQQFTQSSIFGAEIDAVFQRQKEWGSSPGFLWSFFGDEMMALDAKVVAEYRAHKTEIEADGAVAAELFSRRNKAERVGIREGAACTKRGPVEIRRLAQPCKFLYSCHGTPARPTTLGVSSECWSHETGVCPWAHPAMPARAGITLRDGTKVPAARAIPADPLWRAEWATDRLYKPETPPNRFENMTRFQNLKPKQSAW